MDGVGALQEVALAAGDLIGLEGQLLGHAVVVAGEVDGVGAFDPLHDLGIDGQGHRLLELLGKALQGGLHVLAGEVPEDGLAEEGLLSHALGGGDGLLPTATQDVAVHAGLTDRGVGVGAQREAVLVAFGLQFLGEHQGLLGATGVGVDQDGEFAQVISGGLVGAVVLDLDGQAPGQRDAAAVLGREQAGRALAGEEHAARLAQGLRDELGACGIKLGDGGDGPHHLLYQIILSVLVVFQIHKMWVLDS